jgi:hypothetical protein
MLSIGNKDWTVRRRKVARLAAAREVNIVKQQFVSFSLRTGHIVYF